MSSDKTTLFAINPASFSPHPAAPLMSFLETADDEGVPQYYEGGGGAAVERSPPSSSGPPSTRQPSLLLSENSHHTTLMHHHATYAMMTTTSGGIKSAGDKSVDAWRRRQTSEPDEEDDTAAPQQPTSSSAQFSGFSHIEEENESTRVRFEDMTDAEIAQHHFRLAQQHLRAAQRLALAAASAPPAHSSTASSAPSSSSSPSSASAASASSSASISRVRRHAAQQQFVANLVQRRDREAPTTSWTESPAESGRHGLAASTGSGESRYRRKQQQEQQKSGDSYGSSPAPETLSPSSSSSVSAAAAAAAVTPTPTASRPSAPPASPPPSLPTPSHVTAPGAARPIATRFDSTPSSSVSVRSAPPLVDNGDCSSATPKKSLQQRPVPPPRRYTVGSGSSSTSAGPKAAGLFGMTVADPTPLHGRGTVVEHPRAASEDPRSQAGRVVRSISPSIYGDETDSVLNEQAAVATTMTTTTTMTRLVDDPSRQSPPLRVKYEAKEEKNEEAEQEEVAGGPDWDDDDDARSDFYGAESVVSHVTRATLPEYEDALAMSALSPPVPAIPSRFLTPLQTGAAAVNNLHKSATSVTTTDPPSSFRTEVVRGEEFHGFRPRQTLTNYHEPTMHRMQQPAQSAIRPAHVHSPPFSNLQPHAYVLSPTGQPIPIYSAAAFSPVAAVAESNAPLPTLSNVTATRANTLPIHAQPLRFEHAVPYSAPYVNSTVEVAYPNRKVSAATPALTSRPSTGSLSQMYHHPHPSRPQSSWSDTSSGADRDDADTRSLAAGSTFSRTKNRISSSLRAARVPHVRFMSPDPTVLRAPRGGGGSARQAPKTGVRRSASVSTAPASPDSQPLVTPEHDDDEDHKRQRAMQMSLGMLI